MAGTLLAPVDGRLGCGGSVSCWLLGFVLMTSRRLVTRTWLWGLRGVAVTFVVFSRTERWRWCTGRGGGGWWHSACDPAKGVVAAFIHDARVPC